MWSTWRGPADPVWLSKLCASRAAYPRRFARHCGFTRWRTPPLRADRRREHRVGERRGVLVESGLQAGPVSALPPTEPDVNLFDSSGSPVIRGRAAAALLLHLCAMNGMVMAVPAHHQGLSLARGHLADPGRWLAFRRSAKVPQLPDVMDLDLLLRAAELTGLGQESFAQLGASALLPLGWL